MRRLPPKAALATIAALLAANCAEALPLGSRRPPPWFRGWERSVPFVASDYWWWPRYYCLGMGACYRRLPLPLPNLVTPPPRCNCPFFDARCDRIGPWFH